MTQTTATTLSVTIGLDVGDKTTHGCVLDSITRAVIARFIFPTTAAQLSKALAAYPGARVVLEAGSQSMWMSHHLRREGFSVHVVDPRRVKVIAFDHRKNDRRDAETLARLEAGMPELLGEVRHRSRQAHADLAIVRGRDAVVRGRTMTVQHVRGVCKAFGVRLPKTSTKSFTDKVRELLPAELLPALTPLLELIDKQSEIVREYDRQLEATGEERYAADIAFVRQVQGVGLITSMAFILTLEDPSRFESRKVGSWLGLCPRKQASGDADPQLPISKAGDPALRRLLVQSAQYILGPFAQDSDLRRFGLKLVARGGRAAKRKAVTAVARKLAVLLHSLWKHRTTYEPLRKAPRREINAA